MIQIANLQKKVRIPLADVRRLARRVLGKRAVSIAYVTRAEIRRLNRRYLRHAGATDVIAFRTGGPLLGEVVVSPEVAREEARKRKIAVKEEILRCTVHGILHLMGYDDRKPRQRARMWARQERELRRFRDGTG